MSKREYESARKPTVQEIAAALDTSGYLFEIRASQVFEKLGYKVQLNVPFEDPDNNAVSREIDIVASYYVPDSDAGIPIHVNIICECKGSRAPLVLLGRKNDFRVPKSGLSFFFPRAFIKQDESDLNKKSTFEHLALAESYYVNKNELIASQFCVVSGSTSDSDRTVIWKAEHGAVYNSTIYPLVKYFLSRRDYLFEKKIVANPSRPDELPVFPYVELYFKLVVWGGPIYLLDTRQEGAVPQEVAGFPLVRSIESNTVDGMFVVDFVNIGRLEEYICSNIEPFVADVCDAVVKNVSVLDPTDWSEPDLLHRVLWGFHDMTALGRRNLVSYFHKNVQFDDNAAKCRYRIEDN